MSQIYSINYPAAITWKIDLRSQTSALDIFGKKTASRISSALKRLENSPYRFVVELVDSKYINNFFPLYKANILAKENGKVFDVKKAIIDEPPHNFPYYAVSLYYREELLGGLIFAVKDKSCSAAYKVFPKEIDIPLPINLSFLAEYYFYNYALQQKKEEIIHGKDRNCYGQNDAIGLAMFKMQAGNKPFVSSARNNSFSESFIWDKSSDVLIFEGQQKGAQIVSAKLFLLDQANLDKYAILFKQPYLHIDIVNQ